MYYDNDVMVCKSCGHKMFAPVDKCLICNGEITLADDKTAQEFRNEYIKLEEKAAEEKVNKVLEDMRKGPQNVPKCPTCGSTNIKPISSISMTATRMLLGPYSKKSWSQFQCNNCGYMW